MNGNDKERKTSQQKRHEIYGQYVSSPDREGDQKYFDYSRFAVSNHYDHTNALEPITWAQVNDIEINFGVDEELASKASEASLLRSIKNNDSGGNKYFREYYDNPNISLKDIDNQVNQLKTELKAKDKLPPSEEYDNELRVFNDRMMRAIQRTIGDSVENVENEVFEGQKDQIIRQFILEGRQPQPSQQHLLSKPAKNKILESPAVDFDGGYIDDQGKLRSVEEHPYAQMNLWGKLDLGIVTPARLIKWNKVTPRSGSLTAEQYKKLEKEGTTGDDELDKKLRVGNPRFKDVDNVGMAGLVEKYTGQEKVPVRFPGSNMYFEQNAEDVKNWSNVYQTIGGGTKDRSVLENLAIGSLYEAPRSLFSGTLSVKNSIQGAAIQKKVEKGKDIPLSLIGEYKAGQDGLGMYDAAQMAQSKRSITQSSWEGENLWRQLGSLVSQFFIMRGSGSVMEKMTKAGPKLLKLGKPGKVVNNLVNTRAGKILSNTTRAMPIGVMEIAQLDQEIRAAGINEVQRRNMILSSLLLISGIENLGLNVAYRGYGKTSVAFAAKSAMRDVGAKANKIFGPTNSYAKRKFMVSQGIRRIKDLSNEIGFLKYLKTSGISMVEEGTEEWLQAQTMEVTKAIHDYKQFLDDNSEGIFDPDYVYDSDRSDFANVFDRVSYDTKKNRWYKDEAIGGAIAGPIFTGMSSVIDGGVKRSMKKLGRGLGPDADPDVKGFKSYAANMVYNNQEDELLSMINKMQSIGGLGPKGINKDGNPIHKKDTDKVPSLNDLLGEQYKKHVELLVNVRDQVGKEALMIGGDFAEKGIELLAENEEIKKEIQSINLQAEEEAGEGKEAQLTTDQQKKIKELEASIEKNQGVIDNIFTKEEGSQYSKAHNDLSKEMILRGTNARHHADKMYLKEVKGNKGQIDKQDRETPRYFEFYQTAQNKFARSRDLAHGLQDMLVEERQKAEEKSKNALEGFNKIFEDFKKSVEGKDIKEAEKSLLELLGSKKEMLPSEQYDTDALRETTENLLEQIYQQKMGTEKSKVIKDAIIEAEMYGEDTEKAKAEAEKEYESSDRKTVFKELGIAGTMYASAGLTSDVGERISKAKALENLAKEEKNALEGVKDKKTREKIQSEYGNKRDAMEEELFNLTGEDVVSIFEKTSAPLMNDINDFIVDPANNLIKNLENYESVVSGEGNKFDALENSENLHEQAVQILDYIEDYIAAIDYMKTVDENYDLLKRNNIDKEPHIPQKQAQEKIDELKRIRSRLNSYADQLSEVSQASKEEDYVSKGVRNEGRRKSIYTLLSIHDVKEGLKKRNEKDYNQIIENLERINPIDVASFVNLDNDTHAFIAKRSSSLKETTKKKIDEEHQMLEEIEDILHKHKDVVFTKEALGNAAQSIVLTEESNDNTTALYNELRKSVEDHDNQFNENMLEIFSAHNSQSDGASKEEMKKNGFAGVDNVNIKKLSWTDSLITPSMIAIRYFVSWADSVNSISHKEARNVLGNIYEKYENKWKRNHGEFLVPLTHEQYETVKFLWGSYIDGSSVFKKIFSYSIENNDTLSGREKNRLLKRTNSLKAAYIKGGAATGKTAIAVPYLIMGVKMMEDRIDKSRHINTIKIVHNTKELEELYKNSKELNALSDIFGIELVYVSAKDEIQYKKKGEQYDLLVWDEAGLIPYYTSDWMLNFYAKNKNNKGIQPFSLFLGDRSQMLDRRKGSGSQAQVSYPHTASYLPCSLPLTRVFSTELRILQELADKLISGSELSEWKNKREDDGSLIGTRQHDSVNGVIEEFKDEFKKQRDKNKPVIVFAAETQAELKEFLNENGNIKPEYDGNVFVLTPNITNRKGASIPSIQGLRKKQVYLAFDYQNIENYNEHGSGDFIEFQSDDSKIAPYTAVTRASQYVSLVGEKGEYRGNVYGLTNSKVEARDMIDAIQENKILLGDNIVDIDTQSGEDTRSKDYNEGTRNANESYREANKAFVNYRLEKNNAGENQYVITESGVRLIVDEKSDGEKKLLVKTTFNKDDYKGSFWVQIDLTGKKTKRIITDNIKYDELLNDVSKMEDAFSKLSGTITPEKAYHVYANSLLETMTIDKGKRNDVVHRDYKENIDNIVNDLLEAYGITPKESQKTYTIYTKDNEKYATLTVPSKTSKKYPTAKFVYNDGVSESYPIFLLERILKRDGFHIEGFENRRYEQEGGQSGAKAHLSDIKINDTVFCPGDNIRNNETNEDFIIRSIYYLDGTTYMNLLSLLDETYQDVKVSDLMKIEKITNDPQTNDVILNIDNEKLKTTTWSPTTTLVHRPVLDEHTTDDFNLRETVRGLHYKLLVAALNGSLNDAYFKVVYKNTEDYSNAKDTESIVSVDHVIDVVMDISEKNLMDGIRNNKLLSTTDYNKLEMLMRYLEEENVTIDNTDNENAKKNLLESITTISSLQRPQVYFGQSISDNAIIEKDVSKYMDQIDQGWGTKEIMAEQNKNLLNLYRQFAKEGKRVESKNFDIDVKDFYFKINRSLEPVTLENFKEINRALFKSEYDNTGFIPMIRVSEDKGRLNLKLDLYDEQLDRVVKTSAYVSGRRIGELDKKTYKESFIDVLDKEWDQLKEIRNNSDFLSEFRKSLLYQFLMSNKRTIESGEAGRLGMVVDYDDRTLRITYSKEDQESIKSGVPLLKLDKKYLSAVIEEIKEQGRTVAKPKGLGHLFTPVEFKKTSKGTEISTRHSNMVAVHADVVNYPSYYIGFDNIEPVSNTKDTGSDQKKTSRNELDNETEVFDKHEPENIVRVSIDNFNESLNRILGEDIKNVKIREGIEYHNGVEVYGKLLKGRMVLNIREGKVKYTTPRHEIFHWVFRYVFTAAKRAEILFWGRADMMSQEAYKDRTADQIEDSEVEEYLAEKYAQLYSGRDVNYGEQSLSDIFKYVRRVDNQIQINKGVLDRLFNDIESGRYASSGNRFASMSEVVYDKGSKVDVRTDDDAVVETKAIENKLKKKGIDIMRDFGGYSQYLRITKSLVYNMTKNSFLERKDYSIEASVDYFFKEVKRKSREKVYDKKGNLKPGYEFFTKEYSKDVNTMDQAERKRYIDYLIANDRMLKSMLEQTIPGFDYETMRNKPEIDNQFTHTKESRARSIDATSSHVMDLFFKSIKYLDARKWKRIPNTEYMREHSIENNWVPGQFLNRHRTHMMLIMQDFHDNISYDRFHRMNYEEIHRSMMETIDRKINEIKTASEDRNVYFSIKNAFMKLDKGVKNIYENIENDNMESIDNYVDIMSFYLRTVSIFSNAHVRQSGNARFGKNGVILEETATSLADNARHQIKDSIVNKLIHGESLANHVEESFRNIDIVKSGDTRILRVDVGNDIISLVRKSKKGVYEFVNPKANQKIILDVFSMLGYPGGSLRNTLHNIINSDKHENNPYDDYIPGWLSTWTKAGIFDESNSQNNIQSIMAATLYGSVLSLKNNIKLRNQLISEDVSYKDIVKELQNDESGKEVRGILDALNSGRDFDMTKELMPIAESSSDESVTMYSPASFFQSFRILGHINSIERGTEDDNYVYDKAGKRYLKYNVNNELLRQFTHNNRLKNLDGIYEEVNVPVADRSPNISIIESIYNDYKAVNNPETRDHHKMTFEMFLESAIKGDVLKIPMLNMGDRLDYYHVNLSNTKNLQSFKAERVYDNNGNVKQTNVTMNDKMINRDLLRRFRYYEGIHRESVNRWNDFIEENNLTHLTGKNKSFLEPIGRYNDKYSIEREKSFKSFVNRLENYYGSDKLIKVLEASGLVKNLDYEVFNGKVLPSKDFTFSNRLFSANRYSKLRSFIKKLGKDPDKQIYDEDYSQNEYTIQEAELLSQYRDELFFDDYIKDHNLKTRLSGYKPDTKHFPDWVSTDVSRAYDKMSENNVVKHKESFVTNKKINPVYSAFFWHNIVYGGSFNDLAFGHVGLFESLNDRSVRGKTRTTPVHKPNPVSEYGLQNSFGIIATQDVSEKMKVGENEESIDEAEDGSGLVSMIGTQALEISMGDKNKMYERGVIKPLINTNNNNSINFNFKFAVIPITMDSYNAFLKHRRAEENFMHSWSRAVNEYFKENDVNETFDANEYFQQALKKYPDSPRHMYYDMVNNIRRDYKRANVILDNMPLLQAPKSSFKYGQHRINDKQIHNERLTDGLQSISVNTTSLGIIMNLSEEIEGKNNRLKQLNQFDSIVGTLSSQAQKKIHQLKEEIFDLGVKQYRDELMNIKVPKGTDNVKVYRVKEFLRNLPLKGLRDIQADAAFIDKLLDNEIDIGIPSVVEKVKQSFRAYITDNMISNRMDGMRTTQAPTTHIESYDNNGVSYRLDEIERYFGFTMSDMTETKDKLIFERDGEKMEFERAPFEGMHKDEQGKVVRSDVAGDFMNRDDFHMKRDETLNDFFAVWTEPAPGYTGFKKNVKIMTNDDVLEIAIYLMKAYKEETVSTYSPILTHIIAEGEKISKGSIITTVNNFREALNNFDVRIPTGIIGQAVLSKYKMFLSDTGNTRFFPATNNIRTDGDYDGDQLSSVARMFKNGIFLTVDEALNIEDKIKARQNKIIEMSEDAIVKNFDKLDRSSSVKEFTDYAEERIENEQEMFLVQDSYSASLFNYDVAQVGDKSIGIQANSVSALNALAATPNILPKKFKNIHRDKIGTLNMNGDWLQIVLDNLKRNSLSNFGINQYSINLLPVLIASMDNYYDNSNFTTRDYSEKIYDFFHNQKVRSIFSKVQQGNSIDSFERKQVYELVAEELNSIRDNIKENKELLLPDSSESLTLKNNEREMLYGIQKDLLNNIKVFENKTGLNELSPQLLRSLINHINEGNTSNVYKLLKNSKKVSDEDIQKIVLNVEDGMRVNKDVSANVDKLNSVIDLFQDIETVEILSILGDLEVSGEWLRRVSHFVSVRNGVKARQFDFDKYKADSGLYLGLPLSEFSESDRIPTQEQHIQHFIRNNNMYLNARTQEQRDMIIQHEKKIHKTGSIAEILSERNSYFRSVRKNLQPYTDKYLVGEALNITIEDAPGYEAVIDKFLSDINLGSFMSASQQNDVDNTIKNTIISEYFNSLSEEDSYFNVVLFDMDNKGNLVSKFGNRGSTLLKENRISLKDVSSRELFRERVPEIIDYFKSTLENTSMTEEQIRELYDSKVEKGYYDNTIKPIWDALRDNKNTFASMLKMMSNKGKGTLALDRVDDIIMPELRASFKQFPQQLQDMLAYYSMLASKFATGKYSIAAYIPNSYYHGLSDAINKVINKLNNLSEKTEGYLEDFIAGSIEAAPLMMQGGRKHKDHESLGNVPKYSVSEKEFGIFKYKSAYRNYSGLESNPLNRITSTGIFDFSEEVMTVENDVLRTLSASDKIKLRQGEPVDIVFMNPTGYKNGLMVISGGDIVNVNVSSNKKKITLRKSDKIKQKRKPKDDERQPRIKYSQLKNADIKKGLDSFAKEEVQELFNSNPELANQVYSALGFKQNKTTSKGIINVYWGQAESNSSTRILSNLAPRRFNWEGREYGSVEHAYQSNKSGSFDKATYDAYNNILQNIKANIPQNLVSGVEAFGTKQEANAEAKQLLGNSPHSIDMIETGIRTRTTRSVGEMEKYNVKVGDVVKHFGKSADGTTKTITTIITAIHPKGTPEFLGTWNKEGWTQEGIEAIERFKDGAAAIEFEVITNNGFGEKIRGKGTVAEMKAADSLGLMKKLVVESFKQNPNSEATKKLLQYENFTHNTNELIDKAFLEGLKLAQQELLNNNQITPQQKQQALQAYSQYLNTIFPDSKVKDIVYHGSTKGFKEFVNNTFDLDPHSIMVNVEGKTYSLQHAINDIIGSTEVRNVEKTKTAQQYNQVSELMMDAYAQNKKLFDDIFAQIDGKRVVADKSADKFWVAALNKLNNHINNIEKVNELINDEAMFLEENTALNVIEAMFEGIGERIHTHRAGNLPLGISPTKSAWIDSKGVHVNLDNFNLQSPVHEVSHIFNRYLREEKPELWKGLKEKASDLLDANDVLANAIYRKVRLDNALRDEADKMDQEDVMDEFLATYSGITTIDAVRNHLAENDVLADEDIQERSLKRAKNFKKAVDDVRDKGLKINESFADPEVINPIAFINGEGSLIQVYTALTNNILNKIKSGIFTDDILDDVFSNITKPMFLEAVKEKGKTKTVNTLNDFKDILVNPHNRKGNISDDALAESIYRDWGIHKGGNIVISFRGKEYKYKYGESEKDIARIKRSIKSEVVRDMKSFENDFGKNIKEIVNRYINNDRGIGETFREVFSDKFEVSEEVLKDFLLDAGIDKSVSGVKMYSDLKNDLYPQLRKLYDEDFVGNNPLVILHKHPSEGQISISLVDPTSISLGSKTFGIRNNNLLGTMETNTDFENWGGTFTRSHGHIHAVQLGFLANQMMRLDPSISIQNIAVVQMNKTSQKSFTVPDLGIIRRNMNAMAKSDKLMEYVDNDKIKEIIKNPVSGENFFFDKLYTYYMVNQESLTKENIKSIFTDKGLSQTEKIEGLRKFREMVIRNNPNISEKSDILKAISDWHIVLEAGVKDTNQLLDPVDDINKIEKWTVGAINWKSMVAQTLKKVYDSSMASIRNQTMKYDDRLRDLAVDIIKMYKSGGVSNWASTALIDNSSKFFEDVIMWERAYDPKTKTYKLVKTDKMHYDKSDPRTRKALNDPNVNLTEKHLKFVQEYMKVFKELQIRSLMYDNRNQRNYTEENAEADFRSYFDEGNVIPIMDKSTIELLTRKNKDARKAGLEKAIENISQDEKIFIDIFRGDMDEDAGNVANYFSTQREPANRNLLLGLEVTGTRFVNGRKINEYKLVDEDYNIRRSTNIYNSFRYLSQAIVRREVLEKEFMPFYASVRTYFRARESLSKSGNFNETIDMLDTWVKRNIERINEDVNMDIKAKIPIGKTKSINANASFMARGVTSLFTFCALGYNVFLGAKSHFWNTSQQTFIAMSDVLQKKSLKNIMENMEAGGEKLFTMKSFSKAMAMFGIGVTPIAQMANKNSKFMSYFRLARRLGVVAHTEKDLLESFIHNVGKRHIVQRDLAQAPNLFSDTFTRVVTMIAAMDTEGSLDAYTYDKKTGKWSYDLKKDRKYCNERGEFKSKATEVIWNRVKEDLRRENSLDENGNPTRGHNEHDIANIRRIVDKYIVGSVTNDVKPLWNNHWFRQLFSTFKIFSFEKLFNAGMFASKRTTMHGAGYTAVKDENGEWIAVQDVIEIEGFWQIIGSGMKTLMGQSDENIRQWWDNAGPNRRLLFIRGLTRIAAAAALLFAIKMRPDDDEEDYKYNWLWSDFLDSWVLYDTTKNPIPVARFTIDLVKIVTLQKHVKEILNYLPGRSTVKGTISGIDGIVNQIEEEDKEKRSQEERFKDFIPKTAYSKDEKE